MDDLLEVKTSYYKMLINAMNLADFIFFTSNIQTFRTILIVQCTEPS